AGATRARVDVLTATGERDTYLEPGRTVQWDSDERLVRVVFGPQRGVRVPQPLDLLPPQLGRRLLAVADPARTERTGTERVAGRSSDEAVGGARSYGDGYALVAVVPLEPWTVRTLQRRLGLAGQPLDKPWGEGQLVSAGLVSAMTLTTGDRGYVLVGTVPTTL